MSLFIRGCLALALLLTTAGDGLAQCGGTTTTTTLPCGAFVTKWGSAGSGNGQFNAPWGVAVDAAGNVYVADVANNRIQRFTGTGAFLTAWGSAGTGNGQFENPRGVTVDAAGNVYVADGDNDRIQKFTCQ